MSIILIFSLCLCGIGILGLGLTFFFAVIHEDPGPIPHISMILFLLAIVLVGIVGIVYTIGGFIL